MTRRPGIAIRILVFLVALIGILGVFVGGVLFVVHQLSARPVSPLATVSLPNSGGQGGLERSLIGLYLQFRQGDVDTPAGNTDALVQFQVRPGEAAGEIAARLADAGLITDASLFRLLVRYYDLADRLEAGDYELRASMTMLEITERLRHGRILEATVTIREGLRVEEIARLLAEKQMVDEQEFLELARGDTFAQPFLRDRPVGAGPGLEGYLFPDTYRVAAQATTRDVVEMLLTNFDQKFAPQMQQQARDQGLTTHEVVTMASIIEREAVVPDERALIASVYYNRLRKGMYLEADPTVQYAKGHDQKLQRWWAPLVVADYQTVDSPYNSYMHPGLPPSPICSPGLASLQAALSPASTEYLFFVRNDIKGDGSHVFSKTFEEHLANRAKYRR